MRNLYRTALTSLYFLSTSHSDMELQTASSSSLPKTTPPPSQVSGIDSLGKARALFPDLQQSGAKHVRS